MTAIVRLRVARLYPLHDLGEPHAFGLYQHMNVIGHQNISVKPKTVALTILLDAFEIADSVLIIVKGSLAPIAAHNHMIKRPGKFYPRLARHGGTLSMKVTISQYSGLTPFPDPSH